MAVVIVEGTGSFGVNLGQRTDAMRGSNALSPNYFGDDLFALTVVQKQPVRIKNTAVTPH